MHVVPFFSHTYLNYDFIYNAELLFQKGYPRSADVTAQPANQGREQCGDAD